MSNNPAPAAMKPATPQNLTPKLRFPEFREAGAWKTLKLGDISEILRGGSPRPIEDYLTTDINGLNWLKIGDVGKDSKYVTNTEEKVLHDALSKTRVVNPEDLILSNSMSFGRPYIMKIKACIHDGWIAITKIAPYIHRDFLYYQITTPTTQRLFSSQASGSGVKNLNADIIKSLLSSFPYYTEQQKIADCLTSLDDLIAAESQQLNALKAHKKGLMQQLFPREGETTPRRRFSAFQNTGEWNSSQMGMLYSFERNNSLSREQLNHEGGSVKNIHYGDIHTKYPALFNITEETVPYITSPEFIKKIKPDNFCVEGDLIFADASEDLDDVGKCIEIVELDKQKLVSGLHTILARPNSDNLIVGFGGYLFQSENIRKQIQKESQGAKVFGISAKRLSLIQISFPNKKTEQEKIVRCLSALDKMILKRAEEVIKLKEHKKGLMQHLFPSRAKA